MGEQVSEWKKKIASIGNSVGFEEIIDNAGADKKKEFMEIKNYRKSAQLKK